MTEVVELLRCDFCQSRHDIVGVDAYTVEEGEECALECLRPKGHRGPHLIQRVKRLGGVYVLWQSVLCEEVAGEYQCEGCASEDSTDWCIYFCTTKLEEARVYSSDANYVGDGWNEW